jgi:hypothetical protein
MKYGKHFHVIGIRFTYTINSASPSLSLRMKLRVTFSEDVTIKASKQKMI